MKRIVFFGLLSALMACNSGKEVDKKVTSDVVNVSSSATKNEDGELPVMQFSESTHDFGKIVEGEKVTYSFKFKNTGNANLLISSASGSCGCTVPTFPKEPIKPGDEGYIEVTFNSNGKPGHNEKTVTIFANTEPVESRLKITADVESMSKTEESKEQAH